MALAHSTHFKFSYLFEISAMRLNTLAAPSVDLMPAKVMALPRRGTPASNPKLNGSSVASMLN
jgi:hypothetical protein